ncbi:DM4/DM12 family [Popillia japonica]|uniref:DM4/DM12 family n=1 Tax=Popillia japonica TaxID=7064 RepID=A0AAW1MHC6_POPJA
MLASLFNVFLVLSVLKIINLGYTLMLIYPRSSILQLSYGFDSLIPYNTRIIAWGLGMQTTFFFPTNTSNFMITTLQARSEDTDIPRDIFYKYVINFLDSTGLSGEDCLLRAICEVAHTPFHVEKKNGLLEKIAHFIFTPSLSYETGRRIIENYRNKTIYEFEDNLLFAEEMGKRQENCQSLFSSCLVSIIDVVSKTVRI